MSIILLNLNFPPEHNFFKYNSACVYLFSTILTQLFDPTPLSMSISSDLVNIACTLPLFRPLFHIYCAFEPKFSNRTSLFQV